VTVGDRISPTVTPTTRTPITSTPTPRTPTPTRTVGVFCMYFDSGCSDLAKQSLDRGTPTIEGCEPLAAGPMLEADKPKLLAHLLASRPGGISLRIDGYCDSAGAPDMNKYLGCLRADRVRDAVRKELTKLGMTPTHICTVSHGKEGARGGALWNDRRVSITLDDTCEAECLREWDKTPTPRPPVCQHPPRGKRPARPP